MAVNKVIAENKILIDLSEDDVTPYDVRSGVTFHTKNGEPSVGVYEMEEPEIVDNPSIINKNLVNKIVSLNEVLLDLSQDTITPYDVRYGKKFHMRNGEISTGLYEEILDSYIISFDKESSEYKNKDDLYSSWTYSKFSNISSNLEVRYDISTEKITDFYTVFCISNKNGFIKENSIFSCKCWLSSNIEGIDISPFSSSRIFCTLGDNANTIELIGNEPYSVLNREVSFVTGENPINKIYIYIDIRMTNNIINEFRGYDSLPIDVKLLGIKINDLAVSGDDSVIYP